MRRSDGEGGCIRLHLALRVCPRASPALPPRMRIEPLASRPPIASQSERSAGAIGWALVTWSCGPAARRPGECAGSYRNPVDGLRRSGLLTSGHGAQGGGAWRLGRQGGHWVARSAPHTPGTARRLLESIPGKFDSVPTARYSDSGVPRRRAVPVSSARALVIPVVVRENTPLRHRMAANGDEALSGLILGILVDRRVERARSRKVERCRSRPPRAWQGRAPPKRATSGVARATTASRRQQASTSSSQSWRVIALTPPSRA